MQRRAELVDETRRRIRDATIRLHTTAGPAHTSIAAIAEEAGVTRLTVYRHFPTLDELFVACRSHWRETHSPPDPGGWAEVSDLEPRARRALGELYAWFEANAADLWPNSRDVHAMPASTQATLRAERAGLTGAMLAGHATGPASRRLHAAAHHLVGFPTWRSLVVDAGLTTDEAVDLGVRMLLAAREPTPTPTSTS